MKNEIKPESFVFLLLRGMRVYMPTIYISL